MGHDQSGPSARARACAAVRVIVVRRFITSYRLIAAHTHTRTHTASIDECMIVMIIIMRVCVCVRRIKRARACRYVVRTLVKRVCKTVSSSSRLFPAAPFPQESRLRRPRKRRVSPRRRTDENFRPSFVPEGRPRLERVRRAAYRFAATLTTDVYRFDGTNRMHATFVFNVELYSRKVS